MGSDGASHQQIPAEVGEAREEGLQGPGSPTVTLAQDCTRVCSPRRSMSVAEVMQAGFLPALDEDRADMFTPLELHLYRHAQDHRLLSLDILGYPSLFGDILGLSTRQLLSCRCSRIAPHNSMNVTLLVYADNTVSQFCTHTVKSHCPDKGTILVVAVPGSAPRFSRPGTSVYRAV